MQRLLPPTLLALLAVLAVVAGRFLPVAGPLPVGARWVGAGVLAFGAWLVLSGARHFERIGTNIVTFLDPDRLVVDGRFAWSRNPMYLGMGIVLVGVALLVGSLTAWFAPLVFFVVADRWYVRFEERRMAAVFGTEWERYRRRVFRWIGRRRGAAA